MFAKLHQAFWKALTPDLLPDTNVASSLLNNATLAGLGGAVNVKSEQKVALTRVRVVLRDGSKLDTKALHRAGVPGVMVLADNVVHVLVGLTP